MAAKSRPKTTEEQKGMARMMKAVRAKREEATGVNKSGTLLAQRRSNARRDEDDKGYDPYG